MVRVGGGRCSGAWIVCVVEVEGVCDENSECFLSPSSPPCV